MKKNLFVLIVALVVHNSDFVNAQYSSQIIDPLVKKAMDKAEKTAGCEWKFGTAFSFSDEIGVKTVAEGMVLECEINNVGTRFAKRKSLLAIVTLKDLRTDLWVEDVEANGIVDFHNYPSDAVAERMYKVLLRRIIRAKEEKLNNQQDTAFFNLLNRYDEASSFKEANQVLIKMLKYAKTPELQMINYSKLVESLRKSEFSDSVKLEYKHEYLKNILKVVSTFNESYWVFTEAQDLEIKSLEKQALEKMQATVKTSREKARYKEAKKIMRGCKFFCKLSIASIVLLIAAGTIAFF